MTSFLKNFAQGYATYGVAAASILYAVAGYASGHLSEQEALQAAMTGLGLAGLRRGVSNSK